MDKPTNYVEVPYQKIDEQSLDTIIKDFVLREGTDYGIKESEFETKISQVKKQIQNGSVKIFFDFETESINLLDQKQIKNI